MNKKQEHYSRPGDVDFRVRKNRKGSNLEKNEMMTAISLQRNIKEEIRAFTML